MVKYLIVKLGSLRSTLVDFGLGESARKENVIIANAKKKRKEELTYNTNLNQKMALLLN